MGTPVQFICFQKGECGLVGKRNKGNKDPFPASVNLNAVRSLSWLLVGLEPTLVADIDVITIRRLKSKDAGKFSKTFVLTQRLRG